MEKKLRDADAEQREGEAEDRQADDHHDGGAAELGQQCVHAFTLLSTSGPL
jgi:hypothetical protein